MIRWGPGLSGGPITLHRHVIGGYLVASRIVILAARGRELQYLGVRSFGESALLRCRDHRASTPLEGHLRVARCWPVSVVLGWQCPKRLLSRILGM
jgi:hypothetical protein